MLRQPQTRPGANGTSGLEDGFSDFYDAPRMTQSNSQWKNYYLCRNEKQYRQTA